MKLPVSKDFRPKWSHAPARAWLAALCVSVVVAGGCAGRGVKAKVKSYPWSANAKARPIVPHVVNTSYEEAGGSGPAMDLEVAPPPSPLVAANAAPARPRVPVVSAGGSPAAKFEPPTIVPQLTTQEAEAAEQQTNASLSIAERNVGATRGRTLNPQQSDLVSKVRSFVSEAREAAHNGDWMRASNAAKKAQVLSEELARSL
jgi:hypothetical protein